MMCNTDQHCLSCNECELDEAKAESVLSDLLYGVVQWINDKPILDGMKYFVTREKAIEYATEQEKLSFYTLKKGFNVNYTIIRLEKAI